MTTETIMQQLAEMGCQQTKNTLARHGAPANSFGVKVADLKIIQKKVKKNYQLALALYNTGNSDAMYLAGLIADEKQMTRADLQQWVENATWHMHSEYTVPWIAAESAYGLELALEWIGSDQPHIASAGWSALASLVAIKPDQQLDLLLLDQLLGQVKNTISEAPNRVRYTMNNFVISVGCYVAALTAKAKEIAQAIGPVSVNMGETACKVPPAAAYIEKVEKAGKVGNKKKMARC
jgi:3-methyladenine DNA glycosylase AlkD